ncbi:MAG: class I SAM-dependent RNA methyltransferase, partial [Rhodospirillales bacterium]|nr:class I SAM-dependent RNA methyltransferase [Rhodospirillales bacterium]
GARAEADLLRVIEPSTARRAPMCRHFTVCGGCAAQHWPDMDYTAWKAAAPLTALHAHGIVPDEVLPLARTTAGGRRRVDLALRRSRDGVRAGFARRGSHELVDLAQCPVLMPKLAAMVAPLRLAAGRMLPAAGEADAVVNWTDNGADVLIVPADRLPLDLARREALATFAETVDAARVSWGTRRQSEPVVVRHQPSLAFGRVAVEPPPGAFLQASVAGEMALRDAVRAWIGPARKLVDLYAGIGTLSLGLLPGCRATLYEGDRAAVAAVEAGLRKASLNGVATANLRNLASDPLVAEELDAFDAAILDPPRAGAAAQAAELARSRIPTVVAVSCDPLSFARDAKTLVDGGYRLERLLPVDQFLWSPHVELAALFRRPRHGR